MDRQRLSEADLILVGIGEEFDNSIPLKSSEYIVGADRLKKLGLHTFLPAWNEFCGGLLEDRGNVTAGKALEKLRGILEDKNYFVVSVSVDNAVSRVAWREKRLVMPCGAAVKKQCVNGCEGVLEDVTEEERRRVDACFEKIYAGQGAEGLSCSLGKCPVCGHDMIFNNIYAEQYNESGYLEQWQMYKKWLQGTINKKLLILELGVGMRFPTIVRWPFEKIAFFNQKAFFCRVNQNLYQLTEELSGKGIGISQNAIDWLCGL